MRSLALAVKGLWWRRWSSIAILAVGLTCAGIAAAGVTFAHNVGQSVLQANVRRAPTDSSGTGVTASSTLTGPTKLTDFADLIDKAFTPLAKDGYLAPSVLSESDEIEVYQAKPQGLLAPVVYRSGSCAHVVISSGRCISEADPLGVMITRATATNRGWTVGTSVRFGNVDHLTKLHIVGIYEPKLTGPDYWFAGKYKYFDHDAQATSTQTPHLDAVLVPSSFWPLRVQVDKDGSRLAAMDYALLPGRVDRDSVPRIKLMLTDAYANVARSIGARGDVDPSVDTDLPPVLDRSQSAVNSVSVPILAIAAQVSILTWLVLYVLLASSAEARTSEVVLGKLRGLSPRETVLHAMLEPMLLIAAAVPLGVAGCALALDVFGPSLLGHDLRLVVPDGAWLAAAAAGLGGVMAAVVTGATAVRRSVVDQWRRTERRARSRGWVVDAVVATLALAGFIELVKTPVALGTFAEVLPSSAPALLAVVCALAGTRIIPLLAQIGLGRTRRSRHVAVFITIRQLARRSADQRIFVLLTVSITLVVFGAAGWSVFRGNQRNRALTELGASRIVTVSSPRGADPSAVVAKLDPSGRQASAVYVGDLSEFGIDALNATSTSPTLVVVDPRSFSTVAHWRPDFGPSADLAGQLAPLDAAPPTLVPVTGTSLRVSAVVHVKAVIAVRLHVGLTDRSGRLVDATLGSVDPSRTATSTQVVHFSVPLAQCAGGCQFRRFALVPSPSDTTTPSASVVVTALDEVSATGRAHSLLPALRATAWTSPDNVPGAAQSVTVSTAGPGLRIAFNPQFIPVNAFAGYETNSNAPAVVPAIVSASLLPPTTPKQLVVQPASGLGLTVRPIRVDVLPRSGDAGVVISRAWLPAARPDGYDAFVPNEVWLSSSAPGDFVDRLTAAGLTVNRVDTASARAHRLAAQGARYSSDVLIFGAATAAVLAVTGFVAGLMIASRRRLYELAALRSLGVLPRRVLGALVLEQVVVVLTASALGLAAGLVGANAAVARLPEYTDQPRFPPLDLNLPAALCVLVVLALVAAILVCIAIGCATLVRRASPSRLREAAG